MAVLINFLKIKKKSPYLVKFNLQRETFTFKLESTDDFSERNEFERTKKRKSLA